MAAPRSAGGTREGHQPIGLFGLTIGALGVVFGDIGTSPLYAIREAFSPHYGLVANHDTVLGLLSLVFWALVLVVTVKYVSIITRADNEGEGGIMALMALAQRSLPSDSRAAWLIGIFGVLGAALFFGDGVLTPAVSVLAAVEGLEVAAPQLGHWVLPIAVAVLVALFATQRYGTEKVGRVFGPITILWFLVLATLGVANILHDPEVLKAVNPAWAVRFFIDHTWGGVFILGAVVLAVTGGEAIYTDMGHFGARPVRVAWYAVVLPALMLNYLGQGALVLEDPAAAANPFYFGVPEWGRFPMIALATAATVIASQAVITGAFSVSRQAMQLGYIPRMRIKHTSQDTIGQIYIPAVNWTMMLVVVALVIGFGSSSALAAAYGVSVSLTMLIDTVLLAIVAHALWPRGRRWVLPLCGLFLVMDLAFATANLAKVPQGGWFPVLLGLGLFTLLRTWRRGRLLLRARIREHGTPLDEFLPGLLLAPPLRVPGTAVFLTADRGVVPPALRNNLPHSEVLRGRNVVLTVDTLAVPYAPRGKRLQVKEVGDGFHRVVVRFGFMETPDLPLALMAASDGGEGFWFDPMETTWFTSRETVVPGVRHGMALWREKLFSTMHRNAAPASAYFHIPGDRLVELGTPVEI